MKSISEIYKIGKGPSSSHTMGPYKAVRSYLENHPDSDHLRVVLYGSLAATGKGHLTDVAIREAYSTWKWSEKDTIDNNETARGHRHRMETERISPAPPECDENRHSQP